MKFIITPPVLFGLGLGLVLASLVFSMEPSANFEEEDIIQEARELGMVFREEVVYFAEDLEDNQEQKDPIIEEKTPAEEGSSEENPPGDSLVEEKEVEGGSGEREVDGDGEKGEKNVSIPSGFCLEKTASLLQEEGVLADKEIFMKLARDMEAASRIRAGSYELPLEGDSYEVLTIIMKGEG